ncbi:amidohydrolase [Fibrella aquatilis]|uniref:Amidohydrolase n=1 Tax=Fibrella aquatilis TaxID=2817059 RepID=A0A939G5N2_9BACT|nr:amidohydrolase [Fibrella aquatilis]MBO0932599.1 amidohydrolase [Fibrella aquatilis]
MQRTHYLLCLLAGLLLTACATRPEADYILTNATVYTADSLHTKAQAFAVKDGHFVAVGTTDAVMKAYASDSVIDLKGQPVYPGFYDPHAHFLGLGQMLDQADLVGATSYSDVVARLKTYQQQHPDALWIIGRGWDQNDWPATDSPVRGFPTNKLLDEAFPNIPVALTRIDGHAILANTKALRLARVTGGTVLAGGEVILANGQPTGVLVDNAMQVVKRVIPQPDELAKTRMLQNAEAMCLKLGLTTVSDAGLNRDDIDLVEKLHKNGKLRIRDYAMISLGEPNLEHYLKRGPYQTDRLTVRSFKLYADGALGSRGACLRQPYTDQPTTSGLLLLAPAELDRVIGLLAKSGFQANTHCIGDSANHLILGLYGKYLTKKNDRRWRIEHAQVVSPEDVPLFGRYSIIPSVQPTHATSDMYWAEKRLGSIRVKGAYAFNDLLTQNKLISFGSDFPVEYVNPLFGFHAAVARQDAKNFPKGGFQPENAVSRQDALAAMTRWAAYSCFEDHMRGSIAPGKQADFVILDRDIMTVPNEQLRATQVRQTWIGGQRLYSAK